MKAAHDVAGGERDIAIYLVANENAISKADDVMQYNKIEWTSFTVQ